MHNKDESVVSVLAVVGLVVFVALGCFIIDVRSSSCWTFHVTALRNELVNGAWNHHVLFWQRTYRLATYT
jgi:hypothetical protein